MLDLVRVSISRLASDRRGISAVEYGILGAVVIVALVAAAQTLGGGITTVFGNMAGQLGG